MSAIYGEMSVQREDDAFRVELRHADEAGVGQRDRHVVITQQKLRNRRRFVVESKGRHDQSALEELDHAARTPDV